MKNVVSCVATLFLAALTAMSQPAMPVTWDAEALQKVPSATPVPKLDVEGIKAVLLDGIDYKGEATKFFAYYAVPEGADSLHKVPAMVLVHGGGGTAFWKWVQAWVEKGYAAISIDTMGQLPVRLQDDPLDKKYGNWALLPGGIHLVTGGMDRGFFPVEQQWPYCAVSEVMLAHSFICAQPGVDPAKTGLAGNSWGGFTTLLAAAADSRFKFAAPVYGSGYYELFPQIADWSQYGESLSRWLSLWDPKHYIPSIRMPLVWTSGTNDFFFEFGSLQKSFDLVRSPLYRVLHPDMIHTDGCDLQGRPEEIYAMADFILKGGRGLPQVGKPVPARGGKAVVRYSPGGYDIAGVELVYTTDATGWWKDRKWTSAGGKLTDGNTATVTIPDDAAVYIVNIVTAEGLTASSEAVFVK